MTLQDRADSYAQAFKKFPASHLRVVREKGGDVLYGTWLIGQDYRNRTKYYGSYPPGYLERIAALFPDCGGPKKGFEVLHAFSGSLPEGDYVRCDMRQPGVEFPCRLEDMRSCWPHSQPGHAYRLVIADPPYSTDDATKYGTPMINRGKTTRTIAELTKPGGHLVWLDVVWPMFTKTLWRTVGRIALVRSTNHRVRLISIFERKTSN